MPKKKRLQSSKTRYYLLDELRGFAVLCMVFFHGFYTLELVGFSLGRTLINFFIPAEPFFAMFFIFLSGICCQLSRSNLKRGLKLLCVALGFTAVTIFLSNNGLGEIQIYFGILHLLSIGMLLVALINRFLRFLNPLIGTLLFLALFVFTYYIGKGYLGLGSLRLYFNPPEANIFFYILGISPLYKFAADYFPVIPYVFMFLAGACLGFYAKRNKFPDWLKKSRLPFLSVIGRNALWIYILHQPIIYGLVYTVKFFIELF